MRIRLLEGSSVSDGCVQGYQRVILLMMDHAWVIQLVMGAYKVSKCSTVRDGCVHGHQRLLQLVAGAYKAISGFYSQ